MEAWKSKSVQAAVARGRGGEREDGPTKHAQARTTRVSESFQSRLSAKYERRQCSIDRATSSLMGGGGTQEVSRKPETQASAPRRLANARGALLPDPPILAASSLAQVLGTGACVLSAPEEPGPSHSARGLGSAL